MCYNVYCCLFMWCALHVLWELIIIVLNVIVGCTFLQDVLYTTWCKSIISDALKFHIFVPLILCLVLS